MSIQDHLKRDFIKLGKYKAIEDQGVENRYRDNQPEDLESREGKVKRDVEKAVKQSSYDFSREQTDEILEILWELPSNPSEAEKQARQIVKSNNLEGTDFEKFLMHAVELVIKGYNVRIDRKHSNKEVYGGQFSTRKSSSKEKSFFRKLLPF